MLSLKKNELSTIKVESLFFKMRSNRLLYGFLLQSYNNLNYFWFSYLFGNVFYCIFIFLFNLLYSLNTKTCIKHVVQENTHERRSSKNNLLFSVPENLFRTEIKRKKH